MAYEMDPSYGRPLPPRHNYKDPSAPYGGGDTAAHAPLARSPANRSPLPRQRPLNSMERRSGSTGGNRQLVVVGDLDGLHDQYQPHPQPGPGPFPPPGSDPRRGIPVHTTTSDPSYYSVSPSTGASHPHLQHYPDSPAAPRSHRAVSHEQLNPHDAPPGYPYGHQSAHSGTYAPHSHPQPHFRQTQQQQLTEQRPPSRPHRSSRAGSDTHFAPPSNPLTGYVFVRHGKHTKKIRQPNETSLAQLTLWLVNTYKEQFGVQMADDNILLEICQPNSQVFYELEDMNDFTAGCILQLATRDISGAPLKRPTELSTPPETAPLLQELTSLTAAVTRIEAALAATVDQNQTQSSQLLEALTTQLANLPLSSPTSREHTSGLRATAKASASELAPLRSELTAAKRELSVLRQTHTHYQVQVKSVMQQVAQEQTALKAGLAKQPRSLRALIENGKTKLGKATDSIETRNDELRTLIDTVRQDVTQRRSRPSPDIMRFIAQECTAIATEVAEHLAFVEEVRPVWKNAWEDELQNIMSEQLFAKDQQALLEDLQRENEVMSKFYQQVKQYADIQQQAMDPSAPRFAPVLDVAPAEDKDFILQDVFQEISCIEVNSTKRLEAFEKAQKIRQLELANRTNEFEEELSHFVTSAKLRKTGGTEELERQRAQKDREVLKMMAETQQQLLEYQRKQRLLRQQQQAEKKRQPHEHPADPPAPSVE